MAAANLRRYEYSFILLTALIIAFLNNLPFLSGIFNATDSSTNPFMNSSFILRRSVWYMLQGFLSMVILIYFNYSWAKFITPKSLKKVFRVMLLVVYNILLAFGLIWLTILIAEFTVGNPFGAKGAFIFYFWKYLLLHPLAVLIAFVLGMVVKAKVVELENYKLKEENLSNQIKTLQDQINPHFLFNTLNTLSSLIRVGTKTDSIQFVSELAKVYRYILESDKSKLVSINRELEFIASYNYMLQKRFGDSLVIRLNIDNETGRTYIPPMVFQLLVENAIKHTIFTEASPLTIEIYNDTSFIYVRNTISPKPDDVENLGIGLSNLTQRYRLIAGKEVKIQKKEDHFVVTLPLIRS